MAPKRRGVKVEFEWGWGISFALLGTALYAVYFFFGDPSVRDAAAFRSCFGCFGFFGSRFDRLCPFAITGSFYC